MNLLDLVLVLFIAAAAVAGWSMGLVNRALSWLGLGVGLVLVAAVTPPLLDALDHLDEQWLLVIAILVVLALAMGGQAVGMLVGERLRVRLHPRYRDIDAAGGAVMGLVGMVMVIWLLAPAVETVPGWTADQVDDSGVVSVIESVTPTPPDTFRTLRRLVGADQLPPVFRGPAPNVEVGPPPAELALDRSVVSDVSVSIVRIRAVACGQRQDGTGFVVGPGLAITNAHVVAGSSNISVTLAGGTAQDAEVLGFDPARDLALLQLDTQSRRALELLDGEEGDLGAVLGHPQGGDLRPAPAEIAERVRATGRDLYDERDTTRQVYFLAAELAPGDSGAPVIDPSGNAIGVVFAIAPDDPGVAFALTALEVRDFLAEVDVSVAASTQDCV